ncbi:tellurite resistance/C4-dicarboxylate transporter family protein [Sphingobacterium sp. N143]|uniref:tellurite resistance/C4-dicarboxylate transporter family protein n=1 Tax=Sphingobacterium sp. N143 TaxID=2746727 RepID=UPI0025781820|nr:tellurite resistance/C4-dicarboxylate transporter family protein [Sphingobacterium sp. N143]MDM1295676.1 tellurite resistance/C4-dicarboxylate transporter family protein [Sphingobacterium sp. N143]
MNALDRRIKALLPGYFALVMATGIISIACLLTNFNLLGKGLFYLNILFLIGLLCALTYRLLRYWPDVVADFKSYQRGPGFFTLIAALCIMGNQVILFEGMSGLATILLIVAAILWFFIIYGFFYNLTVTDDKKPLKEGINGTWLIIIVSIQALSVLISFVSDEIGPVAEIYLFLAACLFLVGCIFYLYLMSLIIYRISFFPLNAMELGAPYWINMGATAISTLAGSMLILHEKHFSFLIEIRPFLKGFVLLFWAAGSWWIPLLLLLGAWRHIVKKVKVPTTAAGYDPTYWAMVFPLGMYVVSTFRLSEALDIPFLKLIPNGFIYLALFAWTAVMIGFIRQILKVFWNIKI